MSQLRSRLPSLAALVPFEAAARHASFSRAAAELNLTQAAVSRQIRLLEDSLGARLFERRRHGVELTPAGGELANEIAPALRMIAAASDRARASMRSANTVSVFCDVSIAGAFVIPRLGAMRRDHPDLVIRLVTSSELLEATSEPFDVGLTTGRPRGDRFDVVEICSEEIFPVASPSLARKLPKRPTLAKLSAAPLLHFSQPGRNYALCRFLEHRPEQAAPSVMPMSEKPAHNRQAPTVQCAKCSETGPVVNRLGFAIPGRRRWPLLNAMPSATDIVTQCSVFVALEARNVRSWDGPTIASIALRL